MTEAKLVAPVLYGDPITHIDADVSEAILVTGTPSGRVFVWMIDQVTDASLAEDKRGIASVTDAKGSPIDSKEVASHFTCRILARSSDECIRGLFVDGGKIYALIGDLHVKYWGSCADLGFQLIKFKREHSFSLCSNTFALVKDHRVLLLVQGSNEGCMLDVRALHQSSVKLNVPRGIQPCDFDGSRLVWLESSIDEGRVAKVWDLSTLGLIAEIPFPRAEKHYWGFQLSGENMCYVTGANRIKVWKLSKPAQLLHVLTGHKQRIVSLWSDQTGTLVMALGSDQKLKIWREGKAVYKAKNLPGSWTLGYPYLLKCTKEFVFYTADEGVFAFRLPRQPSEMKAETTTTTTSAESKRDSPGAAASSPSQPAAAAAPRIMASEPS